jgi:DNA-binding NtrC family response regulator
VLIKVVLIGQYNPLRFGAGSQEMTENEVSVMARKPKILYVEDSDHWFETLRTPLKPKYELVWFDDLDEAKKAASRRKFDIFICGGRIRSEDSGLWALELQRAGKKVMILSGGYYDNGVPFMSKGEYSDSAILAMLELL